MLFSLLSVITSMTLLLDFDVVGLQYMPFIRVRVYMDISLAVLEA